MPKRRALRGTPLLVATGVGISLACGGGTSPFDSVPVGNLMPPPDSGLRMAEVCVDVLPASAVVTVNGVEAPSRCGAARLGETVRVEISAPGFKSHVEERPMTEGLQLSVELEAE